MQIIGDDCFVVAVQPGSDADAGGLKPGDRLLRVERSLRRGVTCGSCNMPTTAFSPRLSLRVVAQSPGASRANCS